MVTRTSVMARLLYAGRFANWTYKRYCDLDVPFNALYRTITKNMRSFPTSLLYLDNGGIGFDRLSTLIQIGKWRLLLRLSKGDLCTRAAVHSMILRMELAANVFPIDGQAAIFAPLRSADATWLTSLTEFGQEHGLQLTAGGTHITGDAGAPLPLAQLTAGIAQRAARHRITTVADLRRWDGDTWVWRDNHPMAGLLDAEPIVALLSNPPPQGPTPLTRGQLWCGSGPHPLTGRPEISHVLEVRDADQDGVTCTEWKGTGRASTFAKVLTCTHDIHRIHPEEWNAWLGVDPVRIYAHPTSATTIRVGDSASSLPPQHLRATHTLFPLQICTLLDTFPNDIIIFTDGSWRTNGPPATNLFYPDGSAGIGEAGVVIASRSLEWSFPPIYIRITGGDAVGAHSSYGMEFLGLVTALLFLDFAGCKRCPIVTDSQSAISLLARPDRGGDAQRSQFLSAQSARALLATTEATLVKVRAHPETRGPCSQWTFHEWGNHMADHIASGSTRTPKTPPGLNFAPEGVITLAASQILLAAGQHVPYYWSTPAGPTLHTPDQMATRAALTKYLAERERYSADIQRFSQWATAPVSFASSQWDLQRLSRSQRASSVRVMFDKHWHGRNRSKIKKLTQEEIAFVEQCPLCGAPSENAEHWIRECPAGGSAAIRATLHARCEVAILAAPTIPPIRQVLADALSLALHHPQGAHVWTGMWPPHLQLDLTQGAFAHAAWPPVDLSALRRSLQKLGRILSWGASEIWTARSKAPLTRTILAGLSGHHSAFATYYPSFARTRDARATQTPPILVAPIFHRFSPLPSQATQGLTQQQHRDQIRNASQRDRHATQVHRTPGIGRALLGLAVSALPPTASPYHLHYDCLRSVPVFKPVFFTQAWWDTTPHANITQHPVSPPISTWRHFTHCPPPFYFNALLLAPDSGQGATCHPRSPHYHSTHLPRFPRYRHTRLICLNAAIIHQRVGVG